MAPFDDPRDRARLAQVERAYTMWRRIRDNPQFKPEFVTDTDAWLLEKLVAARSKVAAADAIWKAMEKLP